VSDRARRDSTFGSVSDGMLAHLPRRAYLTLRYRGWRAFLWRLVTFPLRLTPLEPWLRGNLAYGGEHRAALRWYRREGRPVTVVIPTYGDPTVTLNAVRSVRRTTRRRRARILVVDDGSTQPHRERLQAAVSEHELLLSDRRLGFAANANRGIAAAGGDVVLLSSDVLAQRGWLERLQYFAYRSRQIGIAGPKLLSSDRRIRSAGVQRNLGAPVWLDHRRRFKPEDDGPANVIAPVLAVCAACTYIKRELIERVGVLDERCPPARVNVDYCLRAWEAGFTVGYCPRAVLTHLESATGGIEVGERERLSQERFWARWGGWFDERNVQTPDGRLRIICVTEGTGVGGGHRIIFEHINRLIERGHDAELWSLGERPEWFDLRAPVRTFEGFEELRLALAGEEAIKVATWWRTSSTVWMASVCKGIPVYLVQDIETSYYPDDKSLREAVLTSYRQEFHYMTVSQWNRDRLRELGVDAKLIPPGVALETFRPLPGVDRRDDVLLAVGRSLHLKNLDLTIAAWKALGANRPQLWMFGIEPELGPRHGARYVDRPSDHVVNECMNEATIFVQSSRHEGFCLPPLEAMAAGCAVVCTDAHGNRDFCRDGVNCLMPEPTVDAVSASILRLLRDPELRARLGEAGIRTAQEYAWERRIDDLETFLETIATRRMRSASMPRTQRSLEIE
jgi:GT2 family glycosyltransferase/glycosyltransferase involved in cell wall biosynthesis